MCQEATAEALRIWTSVPRDQWAQAVSAIPERKVICGVGWPLRETVRHRLQMALSANRAGVSWMGMNARNSGCAVSDGSEAASRD